MLGNCDPTAMLTELMGAKHLFAEHPERTMNPSSPHYGTKDIWVRYSDTLPAPRDEPHVSVWYPGADLLPVCVDACGKLFAHVGGKELGGVLITAVPPGGRIKPHIDRGWHAEYYDKYAIQLLAHRDSYFGYDDGEFHTQSGDIFTFKNDVLHWVENPTDLIRMTLIVCLRK